MEDCYDHEPVSMLAQMLSMLLGFKLFSAVAQLDNKLVRLGDLSAKALTKEMDLPLEGDLPWEQWFASERGSGGKAPKA